MYLKSIEIQGFKSFANRTVLRFHEGVTAVVGPNGSGKSNIADAVRWVLGEQKVKSLRGASMQDVIFAGTQLRKPQGFAHVAITLDNSDHILPLDYTEVTVARRLYRSGESEYSINGQAVRLRDVQELFFDTGIGREGYSIIGQGQIDAILSGKPEDRRGLFDEATGIVKFKHRRQIAEKKLAAERADLLRITDILKELSGQLEPLLRQAETAKEYLRLRDERKRYEINAFLLESRAFSERTAELSEKREAVEAELSSAREDAEKIRMHYETLDEQLNALEETQTQKQETLQQAELQIQELSHQIGMTEAEIAAGKKSAERDAVQTERLSEELSEKRALGISYLASLSALAEQLRLVGENGDQALPEAAGKLSALLEKTERFSARIASFLSLSEEETEEERLCAEASPETEKNGAGLLKEPEEAWLLELRKKQGSLKELEAREKRNEAWLLQSKKEAEAASDQLEALTASLTACERAHQAAENRRETLRNLAERYEGYGQSVRRVMELRGQVSGIYGVVADLIHTTQEYELAIETALSGSIQNIVTDTEETAKRLIEHLRAQRGGRATFLPLSAIRAARRPEYQEACREPGARGIASALSECEARYDTLREYLLGRCLVVDNTEHAIAIAGKYRHSLKIVTLDGTLMNPGGSMSGGAYQSSSSLMSRQRELSELLEKSRALSEKQKALRDEIEEVRSRLSEKTAEVSDFQEMLREIALEKNSLTLGIMSDMKLQYSGLSQKTEFISENITRLEGEYLKGQEELLLLRESREEALAGIRKGEERIRARRAEIARLQNEAEALSTALSEARQKKQSLAGDRKRFFEERERNAERIVRLEKEALRLENQQEQLLSRFAEQKSAIWEEYALKQEEAEALFEEGIGTLPELREKALKLRAEQKALGPVNLQALEEYQSVSERYTFLKEQHDDVQTSERAIVKIIEELEQGMKRQFHEKFAQIRTSFDAVFRELFGGGKGTLELMQEDGEDALSAGIAIIAQPPGKKLQNMMQLSGGEKALTAIALLFAIQDLRPSPFCLLDEIEAALDDSNVTRFAQYLHRLTARTQFILITHRRGTMEEADCLYGVTMQEKGVTALVSVDLVSEELS